MLQLLKDVGIPVQPDRLHLLPSAWWNDVEKVEAFKWGKYRELAQACPGGVVARLGDMLWDVAHIRSLHTYLSHVEDGHSYLCFDPYMGDTLAAKLVGR